MLVVDARVAVKWVIQEPGTAEALELRRHQSLAPDLLIAECANVLWKKVRLVRASDLKISVIPLASAVEAILAYGDKP